MEHVRTLAETIGGRGSGTPQERRAAEYVADEMRSLGARDVRIEPFPGAASTYRPYALAFAAALSGTALSWVLGGRWAMAAAAGLSAVGAWGMLAGSDLASTWMQRLLPTARSHNSVGVLPPAGPVSGRAVLCAHLDSHRTPVFYSSPGWNRVFSLLVGGAFASMVLAAAAYALGAALGWAGARWIGLGAAALELLALALCLHADFTPFSPGANDDASGVGVILALAERLAAEPLRRTEVWLAFTGCEEVGSYGMAAFLDAHAQELGPDALYVVLDEVGLGRLGCLTADGLILKRKTHPRALELARRAATALPDGKLEERVGIAYTDALVATRRGLPALTLVSLLSPDAPGTMHWHQMSDTPANVDGHSLDEAQAFLWQLLQEIDCYRQTGAERN